MDITKTADKLLADTERQLRTDEAVIGIDPRFAAAHYEHDLKVDPLLRAMQDDGIIDSATPADMPASDAANDVIAYELCSPCSGTVKLLKRVNKNMAEHYKKQGYTVHPLVRAAAPKECATAMTDDRIMEITRDMCADFRWPSTAIDIARAIIAQSTPAAPQQPVAAIKSLHDKQIIDLVGGYSFKNGVGDRVFKTDDELIRFVRQLPSASTTVMQDEVKNG